MTARHQNNNNNNNNNNQSSGINVDFPSLNIDFNSIGESLNPRKLVNNFEQFMASATGGGVSGGGGNCQQQQQQQTNRVKDIACQSCGVKFTVFKRKRTCFDCNMDFCSQCLNKESAADRKNHCKRCVVFNAIPMDRNALNGLRVRDLKWFLASRRVQPQMCNEKRELVDLILQRFSPQSANTSETNDYLRRFDNHRSGGDSRDDTTTNNNINQSHNQPQTRQPDMVLPDGHQSTDSGDSYSNPLPTSSESNSDTNNEPNVSNGKSESIADNPNSYFNIDDIKSMDQLKDLSVKQLKLILTRNFIDYKGCVEKEELFNKVERLWNDRQQTNSQNVDDIPDDNLCKICMELAIDCVLLECGHMISCTNCGKRLSECPICRQYVSRVVHIFKS
ncbi:E3 ubiquitin-protein ligase RNF34-like [Oppia nitens]|uniref:E3 ubiquitin-protein ligase RNF34-like n=1 Tax=Oppia nitens TaxID=1686743 RepID=UPI0023DCD780|nr:E3 ubiquitin-protein ligase RNF34-like [Oppia nitens]